MVDKLKVHSLPKSCGRFRADPTINETSLIPVLVASIIEQQKQIDQLKTEIEELKNKKGITAIQ